MISTSFSSALTELLQDNVRKIIGQLEWSGWHQRHYRNEERVSDLLFYNR